MITDTDLAARLRELGADLTTAQTPDLGAEIGRRIRADAQPAPTTRRPRRAMVAAVVATALISGTAGAALASPRIRSALSDLIRFHGITISHSSGAPPSGSPSAPAPQDLELGTEVTYATAQRAATFQIRQLPGVGDPRWVLLMQPQGGAIVTLVYPPGPQLPRSQVTGTGAVLTEFAGRIGRTVFQKVLYGIAHAKATRVGGAPAIYAAGPQRLFLVEGDLGSYGLVPRMSANSLIWATGGVTYRLEAQLPLAQMRALAESIP